MRPFVRAILIGSVFGTLVPTLVAQTEAQVPESSTREVISQPASSESAKVPLTVTYSAGKLMISADNCSLQQVLDAVRLQTGAIIEGTVADSSRVTVQLGPDEPMKVLASLLYGSHFNYIIVAGQVNRNPEKIVLSARNAIQMSQPEPPPMVAKTAAPASEKPAAEAGEETVVANEGDDKSEKKDSGDDKQAKKDDKEKTEKDQKTSEDADDVLAKAGIKGDGEAASEPTAAERLANLPEGIDPAIAALYPGLFGGSKGNANGGATSNGTPVGGYDTMPGSPWVPPTPWTGGNLPTNSAGLPILPSNIPPEIWNLYPKNIMDLIRSGGTNPAAAVIPNGPLAPGLPSGPVGLWDQTLKGPGH